MEARLLRMQPACERDSDGWDRVTTTVTGFEGGRKSRDETMGRKERIYIFLELSTGYIG